MRPSTLIITALIALAWGCSAESASTVDAVAPDTADRGDADTEVPDAGDPGDADTEAPDTLPPLDCPDPTAQIVAAVSGPAERLACEAADLDRACVYTAPGCEPGAKPDLVCTCRDGAAGPTWDCARPLTNCFPLGDGGLRFGTRKTPPHRPSADPCVDPADVPRDEACTSNDPARDACKTHGDCAADELCRPTQTVSGAPCACQAASCVEDADCPGAAVCHCAPPPAPQRACLCLSHCGHVCLPADCEVDADCGEGALCVGSRGIADAGPSEAFALSLVGRYACNDPATSVCVSDEECGTGHICAWDGEAWGCLSQGICL